jgi:hypothetical protein
MYLFRRSVIRGERNGSGRPTCRSFPREAVPPTRGLSWAACHAVWYMGLRARPGCPDERRPRPVSRRDGSAKSPGSASSMSVRPRVGSACAPAHEAQRRV